MLERILILAGTGEARQLADALVEQGYDVITSLAGVTQEPVLPKSKVRCGGFGGEEGLLAYIKNEGVTLVIDATHPFAAQISRHAHGAAERGNVALMRFERSAWQQPQDGMWQGFDSFESALGSLAEGSKVFVTTGRKNLSALAKYPALSGVVRSIEPPDAPLPEGWSLVLERPPFSAEHEQALMRQYGITHLMAKNAGGASMLSKVKAANALGIDVLMIERPQNPPCLTFSSTAALLAAVGKLQLPR
jgi:precorrin-6A/cobalt-precorrin-6A reductase